MCGGSTEEMIEGDDRTTQSHVVITPGLEDLDTQEQFVVTQGIEDMVLLSQQTQVYRAQMLRYLRRAQWTSNMSYVCAFLSITCVAFILFREIVTR